MSDEALVEEEVLDIVDLLAVRSDEDDDEIDEIESGELPEDIEGLKELLLKEREVKSKRNRSLKKSKQATHRMQEEIDALQQKIDELSSVTQNAPNVEAQKQEREKALEQWRDSVEEDPRKAVDFANWQMAQMQDKMVDYLAQMQANIDAKMAGIQGEMNPEKVKYRDKINALKTNPALANLDDDILLQVAKAGSEVKPRGTISGRKAAVVDDPERDKKAAREYYKNMFKG